KRRIEACHLRKGWTVGKQRTDRSQIVRLMQRGEGDVLFEPLQYGAVDDNWAAVIWASVDDTMANRDGFDAKLVPKPRPRLLQRCGQIWHFISRIGSIDQHAPARIGGLKLRSGSDPLHFAFDLAVQIAALSNGKDLEFDAGGSGIDDKDR